MGKTRRAAVVGAVAVALAGVTFVGEDEARACGGCFVPQVESTVVNDHRMVFALSQEHTILWDQIQYSGDPKEFAWVLPVRRGTRVELSRDAWIAALDSTTQPRIQQPTPPFSGGDGCDGIGCASSDSAFADSAESASGPPPVQVIAQSVVGPYETVTLRSEDAEALQTWLRANGYAIPPAIEPGDRGVHRREARLHRAEAPARSGRARDEAGAYRDAGRGRDAAAPHGGRGCRRERRGHAVRDLGGPLSTAELPRGRDRRVEARLEERRGPIRTIRSCRLQRWPLLPVDVAGSSSGRTGRRSTATRREGPARSGSARAPSTTPTTASAPAARRVCRPHRRRGRSPTRATRSPSTRARTLWTTATTARTAGRPTRRRTRPPRARPTAMRAERAPARRRLPESALSRRAVRSTISELAIEGMNRSDVWVTRLRANLPVAALNEDLRLEAHPKQEIVSGFYVARDESSSTASIAPLRRGRIAGSATLTLGVAFLVSRILRRRRAS